MEAVSSRPRTIGIAVALLCVAFAAGLILMEIRLDRAANFPHALIYGMLCVNFALLALLSYLVYLGKNWARILCLGLVCVRLVGAVPRVIGELQSSPLVGAVGVALVVFQLLAVYLLFTSPAKEWFKQPGPQP